jgi:hypothetical protein
MVSQPGEVKQDEYLVVNRSDVIAVVRKEER